MSASSSATSSCRTPTGTASGIARSSTSGCCSGRVVDEVLDTLERDPAFTLVHARRAGDRARGLRRGPPRERGPAAGADRRGPDRGRPELCAARRVARRRRVARPQPADRPRRVRAVRRAAVGRPATCPDSFGHPLQLPQILAGFGIESFLFSRGLGDELDERRRRVPTGSRPDGSAVLRRSSCWATTATSRTSRDADDAEARVTRAHRALRARARARRACTRCCCATAPTTARAARDAGGVRRARAPLPGLARSRSRATATTSTALRPTRRSRPGAASCSAAGCGTSCAASTRRACTSSRPTSAPSSGCSRSRRSRRCARCATGERVPARRLHASPGASCCKCQPHDSICGCSCDEVHRDMLVRYALARPHARPRSSADALAELAWPSAAGAVGRRQPAPATRVGAGRGRGRGADARRSRRVRGPHGGARAGSTRRSRGTGDRDRERPIPRRGRGRRHAHGRRPAQRPAVRRLHALEDEPDIGDLYNFCPVDGAGVWRCAGAATRVLRDGPVVLGARGSLSRRAPAGLDAELRPRPRPSPLSRDTVVRLVRGSDRIEFETTIDNAAPGPSAAASCSRSATRPGPVRAEGQFAVVRRPLARPAPRTRVVRAARPDAAHARRRRARPARAVHPRPARVRGARGRGGPSCA